MNAVKTRELPVSSKNFLIVSLCSGLSLDNYENTNHLLMNAMSFDGTDMLTFANQVTLSNIK